MAAGEQLCAFFTLVPHQTRAVSQVCPTPALPGCAQRDLTPPPSVGSLHPRCLHTQLRAHLAALHSNVAPHQSAQRIWEPKGGKLLHWEHNQTRSHSENAAHTDSQPLTAALLVSRTTWKNHPTPLLALQGFYHYLC